MPNMQGAFNAAKTHCPSGHSYDEHGYRTPSRPNARYCQACKRIHERARKERLRRARGAPRKPAYTPEQRKLAAKLAFDKARHRRARVPTFAISAAEYDRLRGESCFYCGGTGGTIDHVVPLARGGHHGIGNLVGACQPCNSSKGHKLLIEWPYRKGGY